MNVQELYGRGAKGAAGPGETSNRAGAARVHARHRGRSENWATRKQEERASASRSGWKAERTA